MNKTAYVLAGVFLLIIGAVGMFVFLKKDTLLTAKKYYDSGVVSAAQKTAEGFSELVAGFSGKKSM